MRRGLALALIALLCGCVKKHKISEEYPAEMSAIAPAVGKGLPYLVGKDMRPVWDLAGTPEPRTVSDFHFKDQTGKDFALEDLKGKVAIVAFFFSKCDGTCPMTTRNLKTVQEKFKDNDKFVMLSFSVTPEADTPKVLKKYGERNGIDSKRWHLLTGDRDRLYAFARDSFGADTFSAKENGIKPLGEKDFLHSENVYLIDDRQKLRGVYAGIRVDSVADLARDAETLLK